MSFPDPKLKRYILTSDDIIAINEMMDITHSFDLKIQTERGEPARKIIFIFAVSRDKTWYTGQGDTVCEAVDNWFNVVGSRSGTRLRRWDVPANRIKRGWDYLPG